MLDIKMLHVVTMYKQDTQSVINVTLRRVRVALSVIFAGRPCALCAPKISGQGGGMSGDL